MKDSQSKTIEVPSLAEIVRERLIRDIIEGRYRPGQKLPALELADRYGVSPTPVKQALNRLASEGLLEALPRKGVVVRQVSKDDIRELMEARQLLNVACVNEALSCAQEERHRMQKELEKQLRAHEALVSEVQDRLSVDVYLRYARIDREYHAIYLRCANNRYIERCFDQLRTQTTGLVSLAKPMADRIRTALVDHREIYEAWRIGDRDRMMAALEHHKMGALKALDAIFFENEHRDSRN